MKLRYALVAMILLMVPLASASLEKPNWSVGDFWVYNGEYSLSEVFDFGNLTGEGNITFDVVLTTDPGGFNLRIEVIDVQIKEVNGTKYGCYITEVTGDVEGDFSLQGDFSLFNIPIDSIDGTFVMAVRGTISFTTDSLAMVETDNTVYLNISTDTHIEEFIPGFNPNMKVDLSTSYNPPLDFMNFPVDEGEQWEASSYATVSGDLFSDWSYPTTQFVTFTFECTDSINDETFVISSDFNPLGDVSSEGDRVNLFWSADMGMIQRLRNTGGSQTLNVLVDDYEYTGEANSAPSAEMSYEPAEPKTGSNVFFTSTSTDPDGVIASYFWDFGDGSSSSQQNPTHTYSSAGTYPVTLTVMDNYGEPDIASMSITITKSGGGGGSPGFELFIVVIAVALLLARKRFR